jgi:hypothetical protein
MLSGCDVRRDREIILVERLIASDSDSELWWISVQFFSQNYLLIKTNIDLIDFVDKRNSRCGSLNVLARVRHKS